MILKIQSNKTKFSKRFFCGYLVFGIKEVLTKYLERKVSRLQSIDRIKY